VDYNNRQFWGGVDNSEGLRIYDGENMTEITELFGEPLDVLSLAVDSNNVKWIGTISSLFCYDDSEFTQVISFESYDYDLEYYWISDIEIDEDGSVWFVADGGINGKGILAKYTPEDSTTDVETEPLPDQITLHQARPNPFNPRTTISYSITHSHSEKVNLKGYDIRGVLVKTLIDDISSPGYHSVIWDGTDTLGNKVSSGIYIYQLHASEFTKSNKMMLLR